jgi:hypothetical protein
MVERHRVVPDHMRARDTFERAHYADFFTMPRPAQLQATPTDWARAVCTLTATAMFVWRGVVGLRLRPGAPNHVGGWRIDAETEDWTRIEARSWLLSAHVVFGVEPDKLSLSTFIRYDNPLARVVWPPVAVLHQRAVPIMMRQAAETLPKKDASAT